MMNNDDDDFFFHINLIIIFIKFCVRVIIFPYKFQKKIKISLDATVTRAQKKILELLYTIYGGF